MKKIDFAESFSFAVERFRLNPAFYVLYSVLITGLSLILLFGIKPAFYYCFGTFLYKLGIGFFLRRFLLLLSYLILFLVFVAPLLAGFIRGIKKEELGGRAGLGDIFGGLTLFLPLTVNGVLAMLMAGLGFLCCCLPFLPLAPLPFLAIFFVAQGEKGIRPFVRAFDLLLAHPSLILWFWAAGLFSLSGLCLCGIGVLITLGIGVSALCRICSQAVDESADASEVPMGNS